MPNVVADRRARILEMFDRAFPDGPQTEAPGGLGAGPGEADSASRATAHALRQGQDVDPARLGDLEAVVHTTGFPAVRVRNDRPGSFTGRWDFLEGDLYQQALRRVLKSLGRIESVDPGGRPYLGTGWVVAPGRLLTNRHVAGFFVTGRGRRDSQFLGVRAPRLDRKREFLSDPTATQDSERARITGVRMVHPYWDAAILDFEDPHGGFAPLSICAAAPSAVEGASVAVVGYPALDPTLSSEVARDVFEGVFGVKRVSPGTMTGFGSAAFGAAAGQPADPAVDALLHDASTLGGNSGSAIVYLPRLEPGSEGPAGFGGIVALHFAGLSGTTNYSVPLWEILRDGRFRDALGDGVAFASTAAVATEPEWISIWSTLESADAAPATLAPRLDLDAVHACDETSEFPTSEAGLEAVEGPITRERSGPQWVERYPGSRAIEALAESFRPGVQAFVDGLRAAGAAVRISATWRPPERAYLMHWAWQIARRGAAPASVPARDGVAIEWAHDTLEASIAAAEAMVAAYGMAQNAVLVSRHTAGLAIDMTLSWTAPITLTAPDGSQHTVPAGEGRSSAALWVVGRLFGVIKLESDPPHWSNDGR